MTSKDLGDPFYISNVTFGGHLSIHAKNCVPRYFCYPLISSDLQCTLNLCIGFLGAVSVA